MLTTLRGNKYVKAGLVLALLCAVLAGLFLPLAPEVALPLGGGYQTPVHFAEGGEQLIVESSGEIEIQSGGILDVQSGAVVEFLGTVDLDGALVANTGTFTTSVTASDVTATDDLFVTDDADIGDNLAANDGYFTATLGAGGLASLLGGVDINGTIFTIDADADTTLAASSDDVPLFTLGSASGYLQITTGNLKVGNGTPSFTFNGEDAYIESTFEVAGNANLNGSVRDNGGILTLGDKVDITGTLRAAAAAIFNSTVNVTGTVTLGGRLDVAGLARHANTLWTTVAFLANTGTFTTSATMADGFVTDDLDVNDNLAVNDLVVTATSRFSGNVTLETSDSIYPQQATTNTSVLFVGSASFTYATGATGLMLFHIPANANVVDVVAVVTALFDDTGTDLVQCGWTNGGTELVANLDVSAAGVSRMGVAGTMPYAALGDVGATYKVVWCDYDGQNGNSANGAMSIFVYYVVD